MLACLRISSLYMATSQPSRLTLRALELVCSELRFIPYIYSSPRTNDAQDAKLQIEILPLIVAKRPSLFSICGMDKHSCVPQIASLSFQPPKTIRVINCDKYRITSTHDCKRSTKEIGMVTAPGSHHPSSNFSRHSAMILCRLMIPRMMNLH